MKKFIVLFILIIVIGLGYFGYKELRKEKNMTTEAKCFTFNDGTITNYNEICGKSIIIPDKINEVEVKKIANYAFKNKEIESISLPNTLVEIGVGAFQGNNLRSISIPDSVVEIKALAFENNQIKELSIGKGVVEIGIKAFAKNELKTKYAFIYKRTSEGIDKETVIGYGGKSKEIKIPNQVTTLESYALAGNDIEKLTLNDNLNRIESYALSDNLVTEITLNEKLSYIGDGNLNSNLLNKITIKGKKELTEFIYFDKLFNRKHILDFGDKNE